MRKTKHYCQLCLTKITEGYWNENAELYLCLKHVQEFYKVKAEAKLVSDKVKEGIKNKKELDEID